MKAGKTEEWATKRELREPAQTLPIYGRRGARTVPLNIIMMKRTLRYLRVMMPTNRNQAMPRTFWGMIPRKMVSRLLKPNET